MDLFMHYLMLCAATGMCAMTVSKMKVAQPLHALAARLGQVWLQDLLTCPYCLAVWFAFFWVVTTSLATPILYMVFMSFAVAGGGVIVGGAMYRIMMLHEKEVYALKETIKSIRAEMRKEREEREDAQLEVLRLQDAAKFYQDPPAMLPEWASRLPKKPSSFNFTPPRPMPPAPAPEQTGDQP